MVVRVDAAAVVAVALAARVRARAVVVVGEGPAQVGERGGSAVVVAEGEGRVARLARALPLEEQQRALRLGHARLRVAEAAVDEGVGPLGRFVLDEERALALKRRRGFGCRPAAAAPGCVRPKLAT